MIEASCLTVEEQIETSIAYWRIEEAREAQKTPEGTWRVWLIMSGRGFGKTRAAAEDAKAYGLIRPKSRIGVCGPTVEDTRDVCFEGESGLLDLLPSDAIRRYNRSLGELVLVNGTLYKRYSAEKPRKFRGPQFHRFWGDEIAEWKHPQTWRNMMLGLRLGEDPRAIATCTPKPVWLVRSLYESPDTHVTGGSTYDNRQNLAENVFREIVQEYEGTSVGRQEIYGQLLDELPGALWRRATIEEHRVSYRDAPAIENLEEVVVAVDPEGTEEGDSETGIVVVGKAGEHAYVYADQSGNYSPEGWAKRTVDAYHGWEADYVLAETNQGGDMVRYVIRSKDPSVPLRTVHAKRGKALRADPVVQKYEQGRVHHVGSFDALEDQMCNFERDEQPLGSDRVDALVYAVTRLLVKGGARKPWAPGNYGGVQ